MDKKTALLMLIGGGVLALISAATVKVVLKKRSPHPNVTRWDEYIYTASQSTQVSPALIASVIEVESNGHADETGAVGEIGLMQMKCKTARDMGYIWDCKRLYIPELNILYGAKYLAWQLKRYGGNLRMTLSAYNAGTATLSNPTYISKAISAYQRYVEYYG